MKDLLKSFVDGQLITLACFISGRSLATCYPQTFSNPTEVRYLAESLCLEPKFIRIIFVPKRDWIYIAAPVVNSILLLRVRKDSEEVWLLLEELSKILVDLSSTVERLIQNGSYGSNTVGLNLNTC